MNQYNLTQSIQAVSVPMFMSQKMEQPMANDATTQEQSAELSLFDVKELYDLAYAEKAKGNDDQTQFKKVLAEAVKLDLAYRRQLAQKASYKDASKAKNFNTATESSRVA